MNLGRFVEWAQDKSRFLTLHDFVSFARFFADARDEYVQADIICQNEPTYHFYQLSADVNHAISRPFNSALLCSTGDLADFEDDVLPLISQENRVRGFDKSTRELLNRAIYTLQQSIGIALDGLPASSTNKARKVNGDLFERLIQLLITELGIACKSASIKVPVVIDGKHQCDMSFQHDLVITKGDEVSIIGSVKTSSKDRMGKVFVDKMLLNALTSKPTPHIAIFLNDVQRGRKQERSYRVSSTFLPGHFKAYTIKLNPLDGVYYCDLRPNMQTDALLSSQISVLDRLLCEDIWRLLDQAPVLEAEITPEENVEERP